MPPELLGPTGDDVAHGPDLLRGQTEAVRVVLQDVGDLGTVGPLGLEGRRGHGLLARVLLLLQSVQRTHGAVHVGAGHVG